MAGHKFDESGARRIVKTVRRVEDTPYSSGYFAPPMVSSGSSETWLDGKNDSGETIPAYSVVEVKAGSVIDDRYHNYLDQASTTFSRNFGFSVGHDIEAGDQMGFIMEAGWVAYDSSETPAVGDSFGPKPSSWKVWKGYPGFRCVQIKADEHIMLAVREEVGTYIGKADANINKGASGTVSIWIGTPGSESDSTVNISSCYNRTANIASGAWVTVQFMNGHPYVAKLEC